MADIKVSATLKKEELGVGWAGRGLPVTGDGEMAAGTIAFADVIFENVMPGTAD
jgi:hypothetical protein